MTDAPAPELVALVRGLHHDIAVLLEASKAEFLRLKAEVDRLHVERDDRGIPASWLFRDETHKQFCATYAAMEAAEERLQGLYKLRYKAADALVVSEGGQLMKGRYRSPGREKLLEIRRTSSSRILGRQGRVSNVFISQLSGGHRIPNAFPTIERFRKAYKIEPWEWLTPIDDVRGTSTRPRGAARAPSKPRKHKYTPRGEKPRGSKGPKKKKVTA
jgi:hypothetical protein